MPENPRAGISLAYREPFSPVSVQTPVGGDLSPWAVGASVPAAEIRRGLVSKATTPRTASMAPCDVKSER